MCLPKNKHTKLILCWSTDTEHYSQMAWKVKQLEKIARLFAHFPFLQSFSDEVAQQIIGSDSSCQAPCSLEIKVIYHKAISKNPKVDDVGIRLTCLRIASLLSIVIIHYYSSDPKPIFQDSISGLPENEKKGEKKVEI